MIMPKIAFLFPGQGSQAVGMCRALAAHDPEASAVFTAADGVIAGLSSVCFSGPAEELNRTEWTQPALLTASTAVWQTLQRRDVRPDVVAGHSLGEYSALVAAGALSFETALRIVRYRARVMQEAVPPGQGLMAAVIGLEPDVVERACLSASTRVKGIVVAANLNGGGQVVIAGEKGAVEAAAGMAKEQGAKRVVILPVSVPSHSPLMAPAARRLSAELDRVEWNDLSVPLVTNVDATPVRTAAAAKAALVRQLASAVRWEASIQRMADDGINSFVEVGPGRVLCGLVKRIVKGAQLFPVETPEELETAVGALRRSA